MYGHFERRQIVVSEETGPDGVPSDAVAGTREMNSLPL